MIARKFIGTARNKIRSAIGIAKLENHIAALEATLEHKDFVIASYAKWYELEEKRRQENAESDPTEPEAEAQPDEPPLEDALQEWREFYANRKEHYAEILKELDEQDDSYSDWYRSGGYGYDPKQSRLWLINETSVSDFRGTCLDIGSGDGFWSWVLSEWFHVTGIDPITGGVDLANAIKRRLPLAMQRRVDFSVGDALTVKEKYDVVFCRAPSFFNYPIYQTFDLSIQDPDRKRLMEVWMKNDPSTAEAKLAAYPDFEENPTLEGHYYADNWREYLEKMLSITEKLFLFILSTKKDYYGLFLGDTYNHDPEEVKRLFLEYGASNVRIDSTDSYIVGEIYK